MPDDQPADRPADLRRHASHWGAFNVIVDNGRMTGVTPFEKDPDPSPLIHSVPGAVQSESRVAQPSVRRSWLEHGPGANRELRGAEPFVAVSWDEALDLLAAELARVRDTFGNKAIFAGSYGWSSAGRFHHARTQMQRFMNCIGGFTAQVHNYSYAAALALLPHLLGSAAASSGPGTDWSGMIGTTKLLVAFGGIPMKNTQVEPGGTGAHGTAGFLKDMKAAGTDFVSISPMRSSIAGFLEAEWIPARPCSDTAMMLALAHTLLVEDLHDKAFLERCTVGFERFAPYLLGTQDGTPKDADWAAAITGIEAEAIRGLARRMAATRTMLMATWALQRGDHGEQPYWALIALAGMLGQIGLPGGGFGFGYGSMSGMGNPRRKIASPNLPSGENPSRSFIPVARISDMLLHPGEPYSFNGMDLTYPHIKLIYWCGGNPFHHHQDINRLVEAWRKPDTIVVNEPWWTATARHADIVLPATTTLERNDITASSRDRFVMAMEQAIEPVGQARNDHDIFSALARRMGVEEAFTEGRNEMEWLRHLYDVARQQAARTQVEMPDFERFWAEGHVEIPMPDEPNILFKEFREDPAANPLHTPSGRIEIFSERIAGFGYDDCPGHPVWLEPCEWLGAARARDYPLHMVSSQPQTRLHAQMDQGPVSQAAKIQGREAMTMHPADAGQRGLSEGDVARVFNDRGATLVGVRISDEIMPGVIELPTGAWYDPLEPGAIGSLDKHGNPNMLTLDKGTSKLGQAPSAHSALVQVEKFVGDLPEITAFRPPEIIQRS